MSAVHVATLGLALLACDSSGPVGGPCVVEAQSEAYEVTYTLCSDAAPADGGTCFYACAEACSSQKPATLDGTGVCLSSVVDDAGVTVTASCRTGFACQ